MVDIKCNLGWAMLVDFTIRKTLRRLFWCRTAQTRVKLKNE